MVEKYSVEISIKYEVDSSSGGDGDSGYQSRNKGIGYQDQKQIESPMYKGSGGSYLGGVEQAGQGGSTPSYNTIAGMLSQLAEQGGRTYTASDSPEKGYLAKIVNSGKGRPKGGDMLVSEFITPFGNKESQNMNRCDVCQAPVPGQITRCPACASCTGRN